MTPGRPGPQHKQSKRASLAILSPICLGLHAAGCQAAIEPYSLAASQTIKHESNVDHAADQIRTSDWIWTTDFTAALDQRVGRDKLVVSAGVNYNAYEYERHIDYWGNHAGAEFDWNTIGDIAGALGADTSRKRYVDNVSSGPVITIVDGVPTLRSTVERNMQTDDHVFGRLEIGGLSRWQVFGGGDASQRHFSASAFRGNNERQRTVKLGTRYATSPDLRFGIVGNVTRGEYPDAPASAFGGIPAPSGKNRFRTRSVDATIDLKATGNSAFNASIGTTAETNVALSRRVKFIDGALNWTWTPPSHFKIRLDLQRNSNIDSPSTNLNNGTLGSSNLNGVSINETALLDVTYALTAKISLEGNVGYSRRKYSDVQQDTSGAVSGTLDTDSFALYAHYRPTRNSDLSCGGGREVRHASAGIASFLPAYDDNTVQCVASIKFD